MEKNFIENINNLIALCHIIDDFEEFYEDLKNVMSLKNNRNFIFKLQDISIGRFSLFSMKQKKFYNKNKTVIDTINKYSNIISFISHNFNWNENQTSNSLEFFHKYILNHKEEISKILAILEKLKKLGFDKIEFNANIDFTEEIQKIYTIFRDNVSITYLDNLTVVPSYNSGVVSYKTTNSNYKMVIGTQLGKISYYDKKIILNSLIFDASRLPDSITKEEIFDKIMKLKTEKIQEYVLLQDCVNLNLLIENLYQAYYDVSKKIENLQTVSEKNELIELLSNIKNIILEIETISKKHNESITYNKKITEPLIESETQTYIKRRRYYFL